MDISSIIPIGFSPETTLTMNPTVYISKILDEPKAKVIHMGSDLSISHKPKRKQEHSKI
jgi:hypothetical protein